MILKALILIQHCSAQHFNMQSALENKLTRDLKKLKKKLSNKENQI